MEAKKRKNEKISASSISRIKADAEKLGLSFSTVRRNYFKALEQKEDRLKYYNQINALAVERKKSKVAGNSNDITVCRNAMLIAMLDRKNIIDYTGWVAAEHQYEIVKGNEYIRFDMDNNQHFAGITFKQLLILSAIYSQLESTKEKPDYDIRYPISLRSIYEYIHGNKTKWCMVADKDRIALRNEITALKQKLNKMSGKYHYLKTYTSKKGNVKKEWADIDFGYGFFLQGDWIFEPSKQEEELEQEKKEGCKNSVLHCKKPKFLEIYENQKRITTIDKDMLAIETEHSLDPMKIYIAYMVKQTSKNPKLTKAIRYDTLIRLFGDDHRKMVKRYAKFLEEKGFIKNLNLDKDAIRWE